MVGGALFPGGSNDGEKPPGPGVRPGVTTWLGLNVAAPVGPADGACPPPQAASSSSAIARTTRRGVLPEVLNRDIVTERLPWEPTYVKESRHLIAGVNGRW